MKRLAALPVLLVLVSAACGGQTPPAERGAAEVTTTTIDRAALQAEIDVAASRCAQARGVAENQNMAKSFLEQPMVVDGLTLFPDGPSQVSVADAVRLEMLKQQEAAVLATDRQIEIACLTETVADQTDGNVTAVVEAAKQAADEAAAQAAVDADNQAVLEAKEQQDQAAAIDALLAELQAGRSAFTQMRIRHASELQQLEASGTFTEEALGQLDERQKAELRDADARLASINTRLKELQANP